MKYQQAVYLWAVECFGGVVAKDRVERVPLDDSGWPKGSMP